MPNVPCAPVQRILEVLGLKNKNLFASQRFSFSGHRSFETDNRNGCLFLVTVHSKVAMLTLMNTHPMRHRERIDFSKLNLLHRDACVRRRRSRNDTTRKTDVLCVVVGLALLRSLAVRNANGQGGRWAVAARNSLCATIAAR